MVPRVGVLGPSLLHLEVAVVLERLLELPVLRDLGTQVPYAIVELDLDGFVDGRGDEPRDLRGQELGQTAQQVSGDLGHPHDQRGSYFSRGD